MSVRPPGRSSTSNISNRRSLRDFYKRLEALRAKDIRRTRGARTACCREQIRLLEERKKSATAEQLAQINADTAIVRIYLASECLYPDGLIAEAEDQGEIALREAVASGLGPIIFECLGSLGSWHLMAGNDEKAIVCFQQAMAYAHDPVDTDKSKYREVLQWLGTVWGRNEHTLGLARMTAHWRRALDPYGIDPWRDEFLWLVQFRQLDEIQAVIDAPPPQLAIDAARRTAALLAIGRYDDAMDAARTGRSLALAQGDLDWSRAFDVLLLPESPALQGR
jgi:tetratricopeptide (TPR) repeat protein